VIGGAVAGLMVVAVSPMAFAAVTGQAADTTPPTAPAGLKIGKVTETTIELSWKSAKDKSGIAGYDIMKQGQQLQSLGNVNKTVITKLLPNREYVLTVMARDKAGNNSEDSVEAKATTKKSNDKIAPAVPAGLKITDATGSNVTLTWNPVKDDAKGIGLSGYKVYVDGTEMASGEENTATIGNLEPDKSYSFQVSAVDLAGNESAKSAAVKTGTTGNEPKGAVPGKVTTVTTSKDIPWGLDFLPDGSAIYTERDTFNVVKLAKDGTKTTLGKLPNGKGTDGEGGALGLEVSPSFSSDGLVYVFYTTAGDNRIVRGKITGNTIGDFQPILTGIKRNKFHNGGRLRFSPDGKYLFASTGDAQNGDNAQNKNSLNGKVLRILPDGKIPSDNPFGNAVWSYGHRNPQGLAFDSAGNLWEQEFGNSIMDELNVIQKGGNYGWPGCEGTSGSCGGGGLIAPKKTWSVGSCSCSGIAIVKGTIFIGAQRGARLYTLDINGTSVTNLKSFFQGQFGRIRTAEPSPDGTLWITTSDGDKDSTPNNSNTKILSVALG